MLSSVPSFWEEIFADSFVGISVVDSVGAVGISWGIPCFSSQLYCAFLKIRVKKKKSPAPKPQIVRPFKPAKVAAGKITTRKSVEMIVQIILSFLYINTPKMGGVCQKIVFSNVAYI